MNCPHCSRPHLLRSASQDFNEELLFLLGASLRRCHSCLRRYALWRDSVIPLIPGWTPLRFAGLTTAVSGAIACAALVWTSLPHSL